jgi:hypothetical protein
MRLQMKLALANPHRQLHVLAERQRQVAIFRRTYVCDILGAVIGVVGDDKGARPQAALHQTQDLCVERLRAIEQ